METPYDKDFYAFQQDGSVRSAQVVVPLVLALFSVRSVVDVGCGVGGWLNEFRRRGIDDYLGLDGNYVDRSLLRIPAERFRPADLAELGDVGRGFDLAVSLEVAEHLPPARAESFVAMLVGAAPIVMFSAAVPGQQGTNHINEQWQSYWADLFAQHGYEAYDCIRPSIYNDEAVEWWYRQNILVFCRPEKRPAGYQPVTNPYYLDRLEPVLLSWTRDQVMRPGIRAAFGRTRDDLRLLAKAIARRAARQGEAILPGSAPLTEQPRKHDGHGTSVS